MLAWKPSCEDRYVDAIVKGRGDLVGGSPCAESGGPSTYDQARIQSVCEGAETYARRSGRAMPLFAWQACAEFLRPRRPVEEPARAAPLLEASASEPPAPGAGLNQDEIARTVDANWRSIGRDCWSVAPRAGSSAATGNTQVAVSVIVTPAGQVRSATARAGGLRELESCIESSVSRWSFPPAQAETQINLPLVFAGK